MQDPSAPVEAVLNCRTWHDKMSPGAWEGFGGSKRLTRSSICPLSSCSSSCMLLFYSERDCGAASVAVVSNEFLMPPAVNSWIWNSHEQRLFRPRASASLWRSRSSEKNRLGADDCMLAPWVLPAVALDQVSSRVGHPTASLCSPEPCARGMGHTSPALWSCLASPGYLLPWRHTIRCRGKSLFVYEIDVSHSLKLQGMHNPYTGMDWEL